MADAAATVNAKVTYRCHAEASRVFDAWLDAAVARGWMSLPSPVLGAMDVRRVEIDARVGGRFTFSDMRTAGEAVHWGYYRVIDRPRKLVFTWFTAPEDEAKNNSVVTLVIEPEASGSIVTLTHAMDPKWAEYIPQTEKGWRSILTQIDSYLTGHQVNQRLKPIGEDPSFSSFRVPKEMNHRDTENTEKTRRDPGKGAGN